MVNPSFWRDRSVLVTGASGLLGGWLVERLLDSGASVVAIVRDSVPRARLASQRIADRTAIVRGDICQSGLLERALTEYEVRTVFHLAAQTIVGVANRNPISTFETNIRGTWLMLEACRRNSLVKQVVMASSDKAYGDQAVLPYTEATPLSGVHPYDVSKTCADLLGASYARTFGVPAAITRCGNLFGGGDLNFNRLIPGTIRSLLRGERPVVRSDGTFTRDYLYVEDGADAYLCLAEALEDSPALIGQAFNFSYERPLSVLQAIEAITRAVGHSDLPPVILGEAVHEIRDQYLSSAKARSVIGWEPRFTLEIGLQRAVRWYADHLGIAWQPA